ncbi:hypothetical protein MKW98_000934 [Papaver atlanticum]|uniref:Uncharacterized protein n=1 Tax=Papaver atlanticum TaxID=357466 RepID=A0AAD4XCH1_9MAGN|nr:hypothetical protein MKW98_000934 [Papaver atlanticum]
MKITLWAELASIIEDGMLDSNQNGLISRSTTQASRIFVNLDCKQVHEFRTRLGEETGEVEEMHLEQEKDPFEDKISLYEASQMLLDYENKDKEFFCEASVVRLNEGKSWHYVACVKCTDHCKDQDLTIFGCNVEKMLKYTAAEHVKYAERCEKLGEPEKATQVFDKLIGEKFGFYSYCGGKKPASEQLGPKTPQKEKQQKTMLLEDETHQTEKQQKRKRLRRMVISPDIEKEDEMADDMDEKENDVDKNTMVEKRKTVSEQKKKERLRRMHLEDDEDIQEDNIDDEYEKEDEDDDENEK